MKVLITGVDGFVGGYLSGYLSRQGYEIYGTTISEDYENEKAKVCRMDLLNKENVNDVISGVKPDRIFHLAGQSAVGLSWKDPVLTVNINISGTLNLLEAVRGSCIDARILIVGSSDQYGVVKPEECPVNEEHSQNPQSPYGISKKAQEELGRLYARVYGMDIVLVRPFNHIGAGQGRNFAVSDFASRIAEIEKGGSPVLKVGNLETYRDFTDVRDIVRGYALLLEKGKAGDVYNIGSGRGIKVSEVLKKLIDMAKVPIGVETDPEKFRPTDIPVMVCDNSKIRKDTGWEPEISIDETLKEVLEYWRLKNYNKGISDTV